MTATASPPSRTEPAPGPGRRARARAVAMVLGFVLVTVLGVALFVGGVLTAHETNLQHRHVGTTHPAQPANAR